ALPRGFRLSERHSTQWKSRSHERHDTPSNASRRGHAMSWIQKLLPPGIKSTPGVKKTAVPEGLWVKCAACEAVLYRTDLEKNLSVCPKCNYHARLTARERVDQRLDAEGRYEIGSEVLPIDSLKFKDTRKYPERLS